jgi:hypothetical protein
LRKVALVFCTSLCNSSIEALPGQGRVLFDDLAGQAKFDRDGDKMLLCDVAATSRDSRRAGRRVVAPTGRLRGGTRTNVLL